MRTDAQRAKLTQRARDLIAAGRTQREAAAELGVSKATVQRWLAPAPVKVPGWSASWRAFGSLRGRR